MTDAELHEQARLETLASYIDGSVPAVLKQLRSKSTLNALLSIAAAVSTRSGRDFLEHLACHLAKALDAQAFFVARTLAGTPPMARTIVAVNNGRIIDNLDYNIKGSPCAALRDNDHCVVPDNLGELFPDCLSVRVGGKAYVGKRMVGRNGEHLGQLFVVFSQALTRADFVTTTLQVFGARVAAELERLEADARMRAQASLFEKARDAIIVCGADDRIVYWNQGAERLYGWAAAEVIGQSHMQLLYAEPTALADATETLLRVGEWRGEATQRRRNGTALTVEGHWTLVRDEQGAPQSVLSINTDITQRKAAEREIQHLAFYDPLTHLPNRQLLQDRLQHVLASSARTGHAGALLFIDLDNFKSLNDSLGHDVGDQLLQQVALRLSACVRESDTVARLGGDEFIVLLDYLSEGLDDAIDQVKTVGDKILSALNQPYQLAGYEHQSTPSIGVTLFMNQHHTVDELLKRADLAMYQAKASGRNTMCFFDSAMQTAVTDRMSLEADLRRGLKKKEFCLLYQPQVNRDGALIGVEALLRWQHPQLGTLAPARFMALAEETGLILPLGQQVLEMACAQLAEWSARPGMDGLSLAVNVSARQFRRPDFVAQLLTLLHDVGVNPRLLTLELTESLLSDNVDELVLKMTELKSRGVGFSLDDFGTGYSSLSYLRQFPFDVLKIDRSFTQNVLDDDTTRSIVLAMIDLGHVLDLTITAEGVETAAELESVIELGADHAQGFYISRPKPKASLVLTGSSGAAAPTG
jgi:diguanylate cyclase (GGDEF)-like protein/PAS domain S-box-containing protein